MTVKSPLGEDVLLLAGFSGREGISQLFQFQLELVAEDPKKVSFDKLLGQPMTIELALPGDAKRHFNGVVYRMQETLSDGRYAYYQAEFVPQFWLLTRNVQSRIFQQLSVPDILKKVLDGLDVTYEIQGTFHPRDFCVQYRESDFAFASRLMEEEGIYYFFKHTADGHTMVVANTPQSHPDLPEQSNILFAGAKGKESEYQIVSWEKVQELRSGKYTLFDHCFELPHKHLEAQKAIQESVKVGGVTHKLKVGRNDRLEIYDYPGGYAQRFDGIQPGGGDRAADIQKIFEDNKRTVELRMQEEGQRSLLIRGSSSCGNFASGHKFNLEGHGHGDGQYVLTTVQHSGTSGGLFQSGGGHYHYHNSFTCTPLALPFRPARTTPRPFVHGAQTAVVVGPAGEEIFCDKYSRVKVQFHWDRDGKNDADSSCWCRVSTLWAGKQWGMIHIPRIGQEVIVDFLEGDPDQPIITGSVYNAEMMPPYELPGNRTQSGIKSRSSLKGTEANFNEIRFEDKKGAEQVYIHAEKNQDIVVENDETHFVGHDRTKTIDHDETTHVKHDRTETVDHDESITIGNNRTESVGKDESITIGNDRTETVGHDESINIGNNREEQVQKNESVSVGESRSHTVGKNDSLTVGKTLTVTAADQITLTTGDASIVMKKDGSILIKGKDIKVTGSGKIDIKADSDIKIKGSKIAEN
jgi:type VI secretion system secreted protein VgrG